MDCLSRGRVLLCPAPVLAVPVIDKTQSVASPRGTAGTGLCGSVTHFTSAQPLVTSDDATAIMNKPTTDPAILGRISRLLDNINFRNGQPNTNGDYTLPNDRDEVFPCLDPMATPMAPTPTSPCVCAGTRTSCDAHRQAD